MSDYDYSTISVKRSLRDEIRKRKPDGVSWSFYLSTELGIDEGQA